MSGVAKEDIEQGGEFMDSSGREVWVTFAAKDSKVIIGRRFA